MLTTEQNIVSNHAIKEVLKLVGDCWTAQIIWGLKDGPMRFSGIRGSCGINTKTLSQRLNDLEAAETITKHEYHEYPPRTEYSLTERGRDLIPAYEALMQWIKKYGTFSVAEDR